MVGRSYSHPWWSAWWDIHALEDASDAIDVIFLFCGTGLGELRAALVFGVVTPVGDGRGYFHGGIRAIRVGLLMARLACVGVWLFGTWSGFAAGSGFLDGCIYIFPCGLSSWLGSFHLLKTWC